jgi:hypothetical protein
MLFRLGCAYYAALNFDNKQSWLKLKITLRMLTIR